MGSSEVMTFRVSVRRAWFGAAMGLVFVLLAVMLVASERVLPVAAGALCLSLFGPLVLLLAWAAIRRPVAVVLDVRGVRIVWPPAGRSAFVWEQLEHVEIFRVHAFGRGLRTLGRRRSPARR